MSSITIPSYSAEQFVDREESIELVENTIEKMIKKDRQAFRTIIFEAERGSGKTWLAQHITHYVLPKYPQINGIFVCLRPSHENHQVHEHELYLDEFKQPRDRNEDQFVEQAALRTTAWVARQFGALRAETSDIRELSRWIIETVEKSENIHALVLDSVYETSWLLLGELEKYILLPLAALPNVLIILTGRGRRYIWESPDLNLNAEGRRLEPFNVQDARLLLERQLGIRRISDNRIQEYIEITGGTPLALLIVAQDDATIEAIEQAANELLVVSSRSDLELREFFEALSPLQQFREEQIEPLLKAYYRAKNDTSKENWIKEWKLPDYRKQVRDRMLDTNLLRWEKGGYVMDRALQHLLQAYLAKGHRKVWNALNQAAYSMYSKWAVQFQDYRVYYEGQAKIFSDRVQ